MFLSHGTNFISCFFIAMKIAIGTERAPKVDGIKAGVAACPYLADVADSIEYLLKSVPSDIASMPLSLEETMK